MLKNKDKIIDTVYLILLCIIIASLNLFIGSNHQEPKTILETVILLTGISFIIIKIIQKEKNIIIKGKIDILVLLLIIATFVPLINQNYYSLNDTINFSLAYMCAYVIYILARNIVKSKKEINIIIDLLLISSIVIVIFGLDRLNFNIFKVFLDFINSTNSNAYGMVSTIGYSNPLAAYMSLLSFIALGRYLCVENKWIKALFSSYIQIAMIGFVFGNSRALMIMYPIIFILYLIILKDNQKRLISIAIIGGNVILAYIFQTICNKLVTTNFLLWLAFVLDIALVYLLSLFLNKVIQRIKINIKKLIITVVIIIILLSIYVFKVKNISEPIVLDKDNDYSYLLGLKNNQQYNIKINLNANIASNNEKEVKLQIAHYSCERTEEIIEEKILQNGEQNIEFNVQSKDDFYRFILYLKSDTNKQCSVVINSIFINDKEYITKYKYLPNDIIRMLRTLSFRTVSIYERIAFWEDSLKLAKNHLIFGAGGNTFANHIKPYQTYVHGYNKESHSTVLDLLLNYGIFGLLTFIGIFIITIYNVRKIITNSKKENKGNDILFYLSSLFGIALFTLHSVIDFDFNYLVTLTVYYMIIAILNKDDILDNTKKSILKFVSILNNYLIIIVLIFCLALTIPRCYADYLVSQKDYKKAYKYCKYSEQIKHEIIIESRQNKDIDTLGKFLEIYIKDEKYKKNFFICNYLNYTISCYLDNKDTENALKYIEMLYKNITEHDNLSKVDESEKSNKKRIINETLDNIEKSNGLDNEQILKYYNEFKKIQQVDN